MKILTVNEAQSRLPEVCEEVVAGEVIRLKLTSGAFVELMPVASFSEQALAESYNDPEWAAFENHCGKASD